MKCPNCAHINAEGYQFCEECGYSLAGKRCPACGHQNQPGMSFCEECGSSLSARPERRKERKPFPVWAFVTTALIVVAAVAFFTLDWKSLFTHPTAQTDAVIIAPSSKSEEDHSAPAEQQEIQPQQEPLSQPASPKGDTTPCNKADFVSETIPDGTSFLAGTDFTKTWRLRNTGSCAWNTNYELVFSSGERMSGSQSNKFAASVKPGETIDISVDLQAPNAQGSYKGIWKLESDDGDQFAQMWVQIEAAELDIGNLVFEGSTFTKTVTPMQIMAQQTISLDLLVSGNIQGNNLAYLNSVEAGDTMFDEQIVGLMAFDISYIPTSAIIKSVEFDFSIYAETGDPFNKSFSFGTLCLYEHSGWQPLDASDAPSSTGAPDICWYTKSELSTPKVSSASVNYLQNNLGSNHLEYFITFTGYTTDNDGNSDYIHFTYPYIYVIYEN